MTNNVIYRQLFDLENRSFRVHSFNQHNISITQVAGGTVFRKHTLARRNLQEEKINLFLLILSIYPSIYLFIYLYLYLYNNSI